MLKMTLHSLRVTAFGGGNKYAASAEVAVAASLPVALGDAAVNAKLIEKRKSAKRKSAAGRGAAAGEATGAAAAAAGSQCACQLCG